MCGALQRRHPEVRGICLTGKICLLQSKLDALKPRHRAADSRAGFQLVERPLRALVEDGLRRALSLSHARHSYTLPDLRAGNPRDSDPLEQYSWSELREIIYGGSGGQ